MSEHDIGEVIPNDNRRVPVIDERSDLPYAAIDHQWKFATERVKRDIVSDPVMRHAMLPFCSEPVAEALPNTFITTAGTVDKRVALWTHGPLGRYLSLPPVPDHTLYPDLKNAPVRIRTDEDLARIRQHFGEDTEGLENALQDNIVGDGGFYRVRRTPDGLTPQERRLVAERYEYARDIKLLALGAEILDQEGNLQYNDQGEIVLPSGIRAIVDSDHDSSREDLLSPQLWEKRDQIKDRVYVIEVNGKKYILKEKKTERHKDTPNQYFQEGLHSPEEFAVAQKFQDQATIEHDDIALGWEVPVGYAVYPDGFQFALYEYEEGLLDREQATPTLTQQIETHHEMFQEEYQAIQESIRRQAEEYREDPFKYYLYEDLSQGLSLHDFAIVKTHVMMQKAKKLMENTMVEMGYPTNSDQDEAFRIKIEDGLKLEVLGFDFEYFSELDSHERSHLEQQASGTVPTYRYLYWDNGEYATSIQEAAYNAILTRQSTNETAKETPDE